MFLSSDFNFSSNSCTASSSSTIGSAFNCFIASSILISDLGQLKYTLRKNLPKLPACFVDGIIAYLPGFRRIES